MLEFPFWREGMTYEEFDKERAYFYSHIEDFRDNNYKPLWKQGNNGI